MKICKIESCSDYLINSNGDVYSNKWGKRKKLIPQLQFSGYLYIRIYNNLKQRKSFTIHRLVALPNVENKKEVNHIDGNKLIV